MYTCKHARMYTCTVTLIMLYKSNKQYIYFCLPSGLSFPGWSHADARLAKPTAIPSWIGGERACVKPFTKKVLIQVRNRSVTGVRNCRRKHQTPMANNCATLILVKYMNLVVNQEFFMIFKMLNMQPCWGIRIS